MPSRTLKQKDEQAPGKKVPGKKYIEEQLLRVETHISKMAMDLMTCDG
jgi:hypothetical protein